MPDEELNSCSFVYIMQLVAACDRKRKRKEAVLVVSANFTILIFFLCV